MSAHWLTSTAPAVLVHFGEPVTIDSGDGDEREVRAVVDREPLASASFSSGAVQPRCVVHVLNDAAAGVVPSSVDPQKARIMLAVQLGAEPSWRPVKVLPEQDRGIVRLEVR